MIFVKAILKLLAVVETSILLYLLICILRHISCILKVPSRNVWFHFRLLLWVVLRLLVSLLLVQRFGSVPKLRFCGSDVCSKFTYTRHFWESIDIKRWSLGSYIEGSPLVSWWWHIVANYMNRRGNIMTFRFCPFLNWKRLWLAFSHYFTNMSFST
jgi:hypothetical protein